MIRLCENHAFFQRLLIDVTLRAIPGNASTYSHNSLNLIFNALYKTCNYNRQFSCSKDFLQQTVEENHWL